MQIIKDEKNKSISFFFLLFLHKHNAKKIDISNNREKPRNRKIGYISCLYWIHIRNCFGINNLRLKQRKEEKIKMRKSYILLFVLLTILERIESIEQKKPQGFSPVNRNNYYDENDDNEYSDDDEYDSQAQTPVGYRTKGYDYGQTDDEEEQSQSRQINQGRRYSQQQQNAQIALKKDTKRKQYKIDEDELEEQEEPDRLSLLLEKSTFKCEGKLTGYYADETLGCEVFHYCQENQRHSWICPEGFTFHQVHLICMPPSGENICEDSSKYHIVNEYLYKPINIEEHQTKPNITLKYSERYYPDTFYQDERSNYHEDRVHSPNRQPLQIGFNTNQQHRKPVTVTTSPSPLPYRFATSTPHQNVFRSPEEINISLQQRRPPAFLLPSTTRYNEEDYGYEK